MWGWLGFDGIKKDFCLLVETRGFGVGFWYTKGRINFLKI